MYTSSSSDVFTRQKAWLSRSKHAINRAGITFLAHRDAWCSLHRTNQHDNSAYIVQQRGSKHGTSRHHRFGQQNGQRNFDPTSTTLVDADSHAAPSSSSSSPAHISHVFIAASSRSTIIVFSSQLHRVPRLLRVLVQLFFIPSFIVFYVYYYYC